MKPAVFGQAIVLAGALVLTANAYAGDAQARSRSAPSSSGARATAVPRSAPASAPPSRAAAPPSRPASPPPARTAGRSSSDSGRARSVAVPRGSAATGRAVAEPVDTGSPASAVASSDARQRRAPANTTRGDGGQAPRAVQRGDRSRDGRSVTGVAVQRTRPPYWNGGGHGHGGHNSWYYRPSYWYGYTGLGLGYFYYDPLWWGPGYYGYGYGYPGYYGGAYGAYGGSSEAYYGVGQLRLKVKPRDAEVFVDGYFSGVVDDFDGVFQRLTIDSGPHRIEIRKPGFTTLSFDVRIPPDETVTYKGELVPEQP